VVAGGRGAAGVPLRPPRTIADFGTQHPAAAGGNDLGCLVISIQKFVGLKKLNTTMVYDHAHDQTVQADYYAACLKLEGWSL
jgi:hypothetical protein